MKNKIIIILLSVFTLTSCNVAKDLTGAYNMTQCEYKYQSVSNLNVSGMDLSKGVSPLYIPKLISILGGNASSIPLNFTLNLDVNNPNTSEALLNGLQYIVSIDDIQFTTGSVTKAMNIPAGGSHALPIAIGVDLATLMTQHSKGAVENIVKNFIGIGDGKSNVTVKLKPTFLIAGTPITSPSYFPVNFSFGGK